MRAEIGGEIEIGIIGKRDRQGRATEVDFFFRLGRRPDEIRDKDREPMCEFEL